MKNHCQMKKSIGPMKIYSSNGTLIHSTSFPDGFSAKKNGGVEELKTTIRDPTLEHVIANVTFTDLKKRKHFLILLLPIKSQPDKQ